jgi:hypothetical protein
MNRAVKGWPILMTLTSAGSWETTEERRERVRHRLPNTAVLMFDDRLIARGGNQISAQRRPESST